MRHCMAAVTIGLCTVLGGCTPRADVGGFDSPDPQSRLYAILRAGNDKDRSALPHLIDALGSDDQAVRLYAIQALERITGQRKGYVYYAPPARREEAIRRWLEAYRNGELGESGAATQAAAGAR